MPIKNAITLTETSGKQARTNLNMQFSFVLILLISKIACMELRCNTAEIKSPINLHMPVPYEKFEPVFNFVEQDEPMVIKKISSDTFEIEGKFGYINFLQHNRQIKHIYFKSPSEHTVENHQFALEIQIYAEGNKDSPGIVISKLFESSEDVNQDIEMLGFGSTKLLNLKKDETFTIMETVSLGTLLGDSPHFINYQGETTTGNCEMVEWIISVETGEVGENQIKEFRRDPKNTVKAKLAKSSQRITQNFKSEVKLKARKRVENIKTLSKIKILPTQEELKKIRAIEKAKNDKIEAQRKKAEKDHQRKLDHIKNQKEMSQKKEKERLESIRLKKEKEKKLAEAEALKKKKEKDQQEKKIADEKERKKELAAELKKLEELEEQRRRRRIADLLEQKKMREIERENMLRNMPEALKKNYNIISTGTDSRELNIPIESILPHELGSQKIKHLICDRNIQIIDGDSDQYPAPPSENLKYRIIYYYSPNDEHLQLMRDNQKLLANLEKKMDIDSDSRNLNIETTFYIPYIALVPVDYNPPLSSLITFLPIFNAHLQKIYMVHIIKSDQEESQEGLHDEMDNKVCEKWKNVVVINDKGEVIIQKVCTRWKMKSLGKVLNKKSNIE